MAVRREACGYSNRAKSRGISVAKAKKTPRGVKQISPGRYELRVYWTDPKTGRERETLETVSASSPEEAAYQRVQLRERKLSERSGRIERVRFGDAFSKWLSTKELRPSTRDRYGIAVRYWTEIFGDYYLDAVEPSEVTDVLRAWREGFDTETINGRLRVLRTFAKEARVPGIVEAVRALPQEFVDEERLGEQGRGLTLIEYRAWLTSLRHAPDRWRPMLALAAWTGLRFGEISALEWRDVDFTESTVRVRRAVWRGQVNGPKARASKRIIAVPADVLVELEALRRRRQIDTGRIDVEGLVFRAESKTGHSSNTGLRKAMLRVCAAAAGITEGSAKEIYTAGSQWLDGRPALHCLRHTLNNLLRQQGVGELVRQALIGHADDGMNAVYSHVDIAEKRAASASIVALVSGSKPGLKPGP